MTREVEHGSFVIERTFAAPPARVFAAWARPELKARWLACHDDWPPPAFETDFRVGGREQVRSGPAAGPVHLMDARYHDIVPGERIVYAYSMDVGDTRISVSLVTVELRPDGAGTQMVFTEQVAFLDGHGDLAEREEGTRVGFDRIAQIIGGEP